MTQFAAVRAIRIGAIALVIAACSSAEKKGTDTSGTVAAAPKSVAPAPTSRAVAAGPSLAGTLAKPIDQYTGDEFYAMAHGLTFGGGVERERRCKGDAMCGGARPSQTTRLRVDAVDGEDSIATDGVPGNGVLAARALNRGGRPDEMYGMRPGARYEYYLIVLPGTPGANATWRLEELDVTGAGKSHRSIGTGQFRGCNHPFVRGARADFKTCAQAAAAHQASYPVMMPQFTDSPLWIACASGCCTADPNGGT